MKKKILLALTLVALFVCLFTIVVSAETTSSSYAIEFKVKLSGNTEYISVYTANSDSDNPKITFNNGFFLNATYDESTKKYTFTNVVDQSQITAIDFSNAVTHKSKSTVVESMGAPSNPLTNCEEIKWFTASGSLSYVGQGMFQNWTALKSFDFGCLTMLDVAPFKNCGFEELVIPDTVLQLKNSAFQGCTSLKTVTIEGALPNGVGTGVFQDCSALESATMPNITTLGIRMFKNCESLKTVSAPNATVIKEEAIGSTCKSLTTLTVNYSALTVIEQYAFQNLTCLPSDLELSNATSIGANAFNGCTGLVTVNAPKVQTIGGSAFYNCTGLTTVNAPKVQTINDKAFMNCSALTEVTTTSELKTIGQETFRYCKELKGSFDFESLTTLKSHAFNGCTSLVLGDINLKNLTSAGGGVFAGCIDLTSIIIPEGITEIGGSMFKGCTSLKSIKLPSTVTKFSGNAFEGCTGLENVEFTYDYEKYPEFGSAFTKVDNGSVFKNCTSLKTLIFPNSLTHVDNGAFSGCTGLQTLVLGASFATTSQCPAIPKTLASIVISETYQYNGTLFSGDTNKFSCPATFVVYYTGTKTQAEALQAINTSCWEVSHSKLVSYEEFTSESFVRDDSEHYMVYGYNKCEAFYAGEHDEGDVEQKFEGQKYITNFVNASTCQRCALNFVVGDPICGPLFKDLGYSTEDEGTAFTYAILVNDANIATYIENTGDTLVYGFIVGKYVEGDPEDIISADGIAQVSNAIVTNFAEVKYENLNRFNLKFTNITNPDLQLYCNAYVSNGTEVAYIGNLTESYKPLPITFATLPTKKEN